MTTKFIKQFYAYAGDPVEGAAPPTVAPPTVTPVVEPPTAPVNESEKAVAKELAELREYKATADKAKAQNAETERVAKLSTDQKIAEYEAKIKQSERENLIIKLAAKKGLDPDLFDRVRGDDEAAVTADIELLLAKFKPAAPTPGNGAAGGATSGTRPPVDAKPESAATSNAGKIAEFNEYRKELLSVVRK